MALHEANGGAGHRGRNPYHHCLCMCCRRPSIASAGRKRIRPRTLVISLSFALAFLSFFFGSRFILGGYWDPCHLSSLQAWVITLLPVPYRALLDLSGSFVSFFCGILAVGLPGITSVASTHSPSTWSRALPWASVMSCKLRLGFCGFFIIEMSPR